MSDITILDTPQKKHVIHTSILDQCLSSIIMSAVNYS